MTHEPPASSARGDASPADRASGAAAGETWLARLARKASAQVLRGVEDGLAEAGDTAPKALERAERHVRRQLVAALLAGLAATWGSAALFLGLRTQTPDWAAALITAAVVASAAAGLNYRTGRKVKTTAAPSPSDTRQERRSS